MSLQESAWFLFPGIREMLRALKEQGCLVGVVTSRTGSTCRQGLASCGIEQYIDALVTCDDTTAHKPDPEPALIGLDHLRAQVGSGLEEERLPAEQVLQDALFKLAGELSLAALAGTSP
jgi:phosphoglycolate phosphatase-like HAD superfamily hydrolase